MAIHLEDGLLRRRCLLAMTDTIYPMLVKRHPRLITLWLSLCAALVVAMVAVGGYTRLSGSGLSITEWKPIHGTVPPLNESEWEEEFAKYQKIPQYAEINAGMTLAEFKTIFWPEFLHRLLGRIIGITFILPLIFFWKSGAITHRFGFRLLGIFALGGAQGFMGWYMVSSGLVDNVYVNHLRLAAHLALALLLLGLLIWAIQNILHVRNHRAPASYRVWFALLCLQILYGAFMAGLHAGLLYNTYPTMNGAWVPEGLRTLSPWWINLFENHTTVQFIHRMLAIIVTSGFILWWLFAYKYVKLRGAGKLAVAMAFIVATQFVLGVLTLVNAVPLGLGIMHQMTAVVLFGLAVVMYYRLGQCDD